MPEKTLIANGTLVLILFAALRSVAVTPTIEWSATGYAVMENAGMLAVRLTRSGDLSGTSSVQFGTTNGTASAGVDFTSVAGTITFAAGESNQVVNIPLLDNVSPQASRFFSLLLSNSSNAVPGLQSNATVTVLDDEYPSVLDSSFHAGFGAENDIFTLALTSEGHIVVGGQFSWFNHLFPLANLAVLLPDGRVDPSFNSTNSTPSTPSGAVYAIAPQANGSFLIGGDFFGFIRSGGSGLVWPYLARMKTGSGLDTNFVPAAINDGLRAVVIQPDGKILIAGLFTQVGGQSRNRIARLNTNGSLDTSFAPISGANNLIRGIALQPDGRILIAGQFSTFDGVNRSRIARLMPDGTLDISFNPGAGADAEVRSVALQSDGKILIGGDFENYDGMPRSSVARLFANGGLDSQFNPGALDNFVRVLAPAPGGNVWIGGRFETAGGAARTNLALLNSNGLAEPFTADTDFDVLAILPQPDGQTLVAGDFLTIAGVEMTRIARLNMAGPEARIQFAVNNLTASELHQQVSATITRLGDLTVAAQANLITQSGTATPGMDYLSVTSTITFAPFETAKMASVPIVNDSLPEPDETFFLILTNPMPPAKLTGFFQTTITIQSDDTGFEFSTNTYAVIEPAINATITVNRGSIGFDTVSVDCRVSSGTAQAGTDFIATNVTLVFQPGETQKTFSVTVLTDGVTEGIETVSLSLTNPSVGAALGSRRNATLNIDDGDSTISWNYGTQAGEASGSVSACLIRTGNLQLPVSVDWQSLSGTATAGVDFISTNGTVLFNPGQVFACVSTVILNDGLVEGNESIVFRLSNVSSPAARLGASTDTNSWILDNDAGMGFVETNLVVSENSPFVTLTVRRHDDGSGPLSVEYFTSNGTAFEGVNYLAGNGSLGLPANTSTNVVTIRLLDQCMLTDARIFTVALTNPSAGGALGTNSVATVVIRGNDRPGRKDPTLPPLASSPSPGPIALASLPSGQLFGAWPTGYGFYYAESFVEFPYASSVIGLKEDGSIDPSFAPEFSYGSFVFSLCALRDGRILAGGTSTYDTGDAQWAPWVRRMTSSGDRDLSFSQPTNFFHITNSVGYLIDVPCLMEQPDGRILVGRDSQANLEYFGEPTPPRHSGIMRLNSNGSFDPTFDAGTGAQYLDYRSGVQAMALQLDGRILLGGLFTNFNALDCFGLVRLQTNGALDFSFNFSAAGNQLGVSEIKLQSDGRILIVGGFTDFDGIPRPGLARLEANGLIDATFDPGAISGGSVSKILVQPNGRIIIGGNFTHVQGFARYGLARLEANGALDQTFDPAPDQYNVIALALQPDGRILVSDADTGLWRVEGDSIPRVRELSRTNGVVRLHLNSRPGTTYVLEASTNLVNWLPIQTNTATDCALEFTDAASPPGKRFYRAVQIAP